MGEEKQAEKRKHPLCLESKAPPLFFCKFQEKRLLIFVNHETYFVCHLSVFFPNNYGAAIHMERCNFGNNL